MASKSTAYCELPSSWFEGTVHSAYLRLALAFAQRMGLKADVRLPSVDRLVPMLDALPLLDVLDARRNPHGGAALGAAITASAHGSMGYAAVSSATIGQALQAIARFTPMRNRLFDYRCRTDATGTELSVLPRIDMGAYRGFLEIATAVSVFKTVQSLAGDGAAQRMHMDVTWQRGDPLDVPTPVRYSQPTTSLRVPAEVAGVRTLTADPKLHAYACRSCEEELAALSGSVTAQLRRLLPGVGQNWPSLTEAAGKLAMSRSTLIRRLADEGLAFQDVLDQTRRELACWYLRETEMPIISVAERLGYIDPSNFSRSFRRWQGTAPLQYRQSQRPQVAASLQEADTGAGVFAQAPGHHAAG